VINTIANIHGQVNPILVEKPLENES